MYLRTKRPRFWVAADFDQSELPHRYSGHSLLHPLDQGNIFVIGTYYRPPSSNISNFLEKLECVLKIFRRKFSHLKLNICGDFNLNLLRERENIGIHKYVILQLSHKLSLIILKPARVITSSATLIHHIWTNDSIASVSGVIPCNVSDHFPIFSWANLNNSFLNDRTFETVNFRKLNMLNKLMKQVLMKQVLCLHLKLYKRSHKITKHKKKTFFPLEKKAKLIDKS